MINGLLDGVEPGVTAAWNKKLEKCVGLSRLSLKRLLKTHLETLNANLAKILWTWRITSLKSFLPLVIKIAVCTFLAIGKTCVFKLLLTAKIENYHSTLSLKKNWFRIRPWCVNICTLPSAISHLPLLVFKHFFQHPPL